MSVLPVSIYAASLLSSSFVLGPVVIQPDFNAATTSSISKSVISGGLKRIILFSSLNSLMLFPSHQVSVPRTIQFPQPIHSFAMRIIIATDISCQTKIFHQYNFFPFDRYAKSCYDVIINRLTPLRRVGGSPVFGPSFFMRSLISSGFSKSLTLYIVFSQFPYSTP